MRSLDEAIQWASKYAAVVDGAEVDVRPANEPWDIGLGQKPAGLTTRRYRAMHKATAKSEAAAPETDRLGAPLGEVELDIRPVASYTVFGR